jgi:large subunit ribosomal protein L10
MDRAEKEAAVAEIAERLGEVETVLAVDYRGISVTQAAELRAKLREADASFKVVKNRLAKLAVEQAGTDGLTELLVGPTALTFVQGDVVTAAKAINSFNREHDILAFKGGLMDGEPLDEDRFKTLARLPSLEVMHGQLVGMAASPLSGLVRGLNAMVTGLAVALGQIQEQGLVGGKAEASTEEPDRPEAQPEADPSEPDAPAEDSDRSDVEPESEED